MSDTPEMPETTDETVLATIAPSAGRRIMGITVLSILGGALVYLALVRPPEALGWQAFLLGLGAATLFLASALRRATEHRLELTREVLRDSSGRLVARVDQIDRVDRGVFAIKPSNGFTLYLSQSAEGSHWAPGLWWRLGRRVGVGGITSAAEAKAMAEILTALAVEAYERTSTR